MNMTQKRNMVSSYVLFFLSFLVALALDQWSKFLAITYLKGRKALDLIPGVFQLHYLENKGAAFGIMQGGQIIFIVGAVVLTLLIVLLYGRIPRTRHYVPMRFCAVLVVAGAVGNMIDRIRLRYVVDFFYFKLIDFPIFNVADCYVVVSCILFVFLIFFVYNDDHDFDFLKRTEDDRS